jgi:nitrate/nitrite transport system permease protein
MNNLNFNSVFQKVILTIAGLAVFLLLWATLAQNIKTSLGVFPGPNAVYSQLINLYDEHQAEALKEQKFYERQEKRNAKKLAKNPDYKAKIRPYTGPATFFDQILTSLKTVLTAFVLGSLIAIPIGIIIGISEKTYTAVNPIIQIFKPVSPLAWLPLVTIVVSSLYVSDNPMFEKSFIIATITVILSSIWPTIINTAVGVAGVSKDLLNVSFVLRLDPFTHVRKIIIPASIPMIFAGLRVSIGIAWMVLIAAEMLSQSPGLGKFVWDEFQNGSSQSMSRIMSAVIVIGIIGFMLDRVILLLQKKLSWDKNAITR